MVRLGEWLSGGWALIKDDIVTFAVAALLAGLIGGATGGICMPPLVIGLYMMVGSRMRGDSVEIGDVFRGFEKFGPAFLAYLLVAIAVYALYALFIILTLVLGNIPVIGLILFIVLFVGYAIAVLVIGALAFYVLPAIAFTEVSAVDAIRTSVEKVRGDIPMHSIHLPCWCSRLSAVSA